MEKWYHSWKTGLNKILNFKTNSRYDSSSEIPCTDLVTWIYLREGIQNIPQKLLEVWVNLLRVFIIFIFLTKNFNEKPNFHKAKVRTYSQVIQKKKKKKRRDINYADIEKFKDSNYLEYKIKDKYKTFWSTKPPLNILIVQKFHKIAKKVVVNNTSIFDNGGWNNIFSSSSNTNYYELTLKISRNSSISREAKLPLYSTWFKLSEAHLYKMHHCSPAAWGKFLSRIDNVNLLLLDFPSKEVDLKKTRMVWNEEKWISFLPTQKSLKETPVCLMETDLQKDINNH